MSKVKPEKKDLSTKKYELVSSVNIKTNEISDKENQYEETIAETLEEHEECPSCFEGPDRWIYECSECGFVGCYDGVYENGCYSGFPNETQCPECGGIERARIGQVGEGTIEK